MTSRRSSSSSSSAALSVQQVAAPDRFADVDVLWDDLLGRGTRATRLSVSCAPVSPSPAKDVTRRAGIGNEDLTDLIAPNQVIARYRGGDTVVLQGLHHTDRRLAQVANNLALALDHPVQVNAYFSPEGARGLDLHFDYHDVFVVQLGGCKRWRIWEPLPRTVDPIKGRHTIAKPRFEELGDPLLDLTLTAGDCLYLHAGFPHSAETIDEASEHLTIGLVAVTWQRVVRKAIDAEVAAGRLSAALPPGMLEPGARAPSAAVGAGGRARPAGARGAPPLDGARDLAQATGDPPAAAVGSTARLRATVVHAGSTRVVDDDRRTARCSDSATACSTCPARRLDFLAALLDTESPMAPSDLEGSRRRSRAVVLRRLLAEGVLAHAG